MTSNYADISKLIGQQFRDYLKLVHEIQKHRVRSRELLLLLWRRSRRDNIDVWSEVFATDLANAGSQIKGSALTLALRRHLAVLQENRCCYCRRWLVNTAYARPIEHILPRKKYAKYSLNYRNMALACKDCNSEKSDNTTFTSLETHGRYPQASAFSKMFHPRYHRYDQHVRFVRYETNGSAITLYRGLTVQGRQLCSELLYKIAENETLLKSNPALAPAIDALNQYDNEGDPKLTQAVEDFLEHLNRSATLVLKKSD